MPKTARKPIEKPNLSDYIHINEIIPDSFISHNPCNLPLTLIEHNDGLLLPYVIPEDLQEEVAQQQINRRENKPVVGHGCDLFQSIKKKIFLKTYIISAGNKAKSCYIARIARQTVDYNCQSDSPYFDPIFAQLVHFIANFTLDGCEENITQLGMFSSRGFIPAIAKLRAYRKDVWGATTTIAHETAPQIESNRNRKLANVTEFVEMKEIVSPDEKHE